MRVLSFDKTKYSISATELVNKISSSVPASVQIDILKETYPDGRIRGNQFLLGVTTG
jgi:hypothetical protein